MAITTAPVQRTDAPAVPVATPAGAAPFGLFGTGPAAPREGALAGTGTADLAVGLAFGLAVGVLGVLPGPPASDRTPDQPRRTPRRLVRRAARWGAGPDGAHLAWGAAPAVYRLGGVADRSVARVPSAAPVPTPAAAAAPAAPPVDPDLEAAIAFATDFSVDLLRTPVRLAAPAPRRTAPVRRLLGLLRGSARRAAGWGSGTHGAHLAWDRPTPPRVHGLTLAEPPAVTQPAAPVLRHRAPEEDEAVPMRELPSTPTAPPQPRNRSTGLRTSANPSRLFRVATCSPRARNSPAPSGWSPRRTGSPAPRAWRPSRPVGTRSMPRSLRASPCRWSNRTSTARGARSPSSSPGARGQPPARGSPSSSPVRA